MRRAIFILLLIMLGMFACVAAVYREEISDTQAYLRHSLLPHEPDRGDLAP